MFSGLVAHFGHQRKGETFLGTIIEELTLSDFLRVVDSGVSREEVTDDACNSRIGARLSPE